MYIKRTRTTIRGKTYENHLLVEAVRTPNGPPTRTVCSLGSLKPRPAAEWLKLARRMETAIRGQTCLFEDSDDPQIEQLIKHLAQRKRRKGEEKQREEEVVVANVVSVDVDKVELKDVREAGPVHVGNHFYDLLGIDNVLRTC